MQFERRYAHAADFWRFLLDERAVKQSPPRAHRSPDLSHSSHSSPAAADASPACAAAVSPLRRDAVTAEAARAAVAHFVALGTLAPPPEEEALLAAAAGESVPSASLKRLRTMRL